MRLTLAVAAMLCEDSELAAICELKPNGDEVLILS